MSPTSNSAAQLTSDETRILNECNRESTIYRSLPLGVLTVYATQYAMMKNIISTKAKWIKFGTALLAGYILGKISYASACRKKILSQIPDSSLAQMIVGGEVQQTSDVNINTYQERQTKNSNESTIFIPDTHRTSINVNQYGDPIYKTNK